MHIPDGVLSLPTTLATGAIALAGLSVAVSKLSARNRDRTTVLMGTMAAFVFAAQMVNFPLYPFPISGHLLGGVLAAVMLGPWAGAGVMAVVLIVQCLLAGDGGPLSLGANFLNMGLIGSIGGYAIYAPIRRGLGGSRGVVIGSMAAAWFSVILASAAFAVELAASGRMADFPEILGWMVLVHSVIGVGEAIITGLVVRFVLQVRPDLILDDDEDSENPRSPARRWGQVALAGLAIASAVAIFLAPLASTNLDGLEFVGGRLKFIDPLRETASALLPVPVPDYEMPGLARWKPLATASAGFLGTSIVFGVGFGLARVFSERKPLKTVEGRKVEHDEL